MKTFDYVGCGNYFVANFSKLVAVNVTKVRIEVDTNRVYYTVTIDGKEVELDDKTCFYRSEKDFLNDVVVEKVSLKMYDIRRDLNCNYDCDKNEITAWIFNENIAEEVSLRLHEIVVEGMKCKYTIVDNRGFVVNTKLYESRQEVLDNNIVTVIDKQGNESQLVGYKLKLQLNDEQQQLVNQLAESIKKLNDAGVKLVFDDDEYCIRAFNEKNFDNAEQVFYNDNREFEHEIVNVDLPIIGHVDYTAYEERLIGVNLIED